MTALLDVLLPLLVIFVMTIVGLELRPADFGRVRKHPIALPGLVLGQWAVAGGIAVLMARWQWVPLPAATGLVLLAASPAAPIANYYAQLSRSAVALAVTATALSSVLAAVLTPLVAVQGLRPALGAAATVVLPVADMALQLVVGLLLPIGAGMVLRAVAPGAVAAWQPRLQRLSLVAVAVVLAGVLMDQWLLIRSQAAAIAAAGLLFSGAVLAAGAFVTALFLAGRLERRALMWGFPVRSVAVATLMAQSTIGEPTVLAALAIVFVSQACLAVPLAFWLAREAAPVASAAR